MNACWITSFSRRQLPDNGAYLPPHHTHLPPCLPLPRLQVPAQRVRVLDEVMGDLTDYGVDVLYILTPGHSPGHTLYKHAPSDTVLAGDAVWLVKPQLALAPVGGPQDNRVRSTAVPGRQAGGRGVQGMCWVLWLPPVLQGTGFAG
jgi:glyoxylase-like metal-dependent hydrolase (beta-lactamase superfamily II)